MQGAGARHGRPSREGARRASSRADPSPIERRLLLTATMCLLAFGAVMVYSSSSASSLLAGSGTGSSYLVKFLIYAALGLAAMHYLARNGVARLHSITGPLVAISFVLVLAVHVPGLGVTVNGAKRWLGRGSFEFQPSELMKLALILYCAELLARRPARVHDLRALARPMLTVVGAACLLVVTQPDLGTAMVICFTVAAILIAAGIPPRKLAMLAGGLAFGVFVYALIRPYARARLTSFLDPWAHASSSGFQSVQGQIAIGSGGLLGAGPGQSVQKIFYLPEAPTDFILAVIGEELGVAGVAALLALYGMIAYAGLLAAKKARSLHSGLLAVGVTAMIVSQALLNVFAVLGLAPLTGVPLPFVSYGASSLVVTLAGMGVLLNVAAGGTAHVRAVADRSRRPRSIDVRGADAAGWEHGQREAQADRDRGRRNRGTRRARAGGRRRAAS